MGLTPEQLVETAEKATVLARLSPTQKEQVIQALQGKGHVVGFMGDGINDAPALKKADVGISVDTAVDVAKEAADIVLLEKSLLVLDDGIIEGRKVFGNIIKYIRMGASSNFGNMFSVVGGSFFLPFLPMLPIQVLTNNMLYDVSQIGIPSDRVDPGVHHGAAEMEHRQHPPIHVFHRAHELHLRLRHVLPDALFSSGASPSPPPSTSPDMKGVLRDAFSTRDGSWNPSSPRPSSCTSSGRARIPFIQSRASPVMYFFTLLVMAIGVALPYIAPRRLLRLRAAARHLLGVDRRFPRAVLRASPTS